MKETSAGYSPFLGRAITRCHPPLEGEGRTAEGSPGWGDGSAADNREAAYAEALSPPPGPLTRADLPPPGGGEGPPYAIFIVQAEAQGVKGRAHA
jgi:hypothetical protein